MRLFLAGALSDYANRVNILAVGFGFLVAADLVFAFTGGLGGTAIGVALWGLHMGFTQGLLASLVADTCPPELRGTAYGVFNLLTGVATLIASVLAGALWDMEGSRATFFASAILTGVALVGLGAIRRVAPRVGQVSEAAHRALGAGFRGLSKFRRRKRHCRPSQDHLEGRFKLGRWVTTQRYLKDDLSVERKKRLDAIGFVWNWRDDRWEQGFAALLRFKRREGHCRVPIRHYEGNFRLGYWVSRQRRKRTELPALRKRRLNKIGFVWREDQGYRRAP